MLLHHISYAVSDDPGLARSGTGKYEQMVGVDKRYTVLPIPSRELTLNKELKQHPLWVAVSETEEEQ